MRHMSEGSLHVSFIRYYLARHGDETVLSLSNWSFRYQVLYGFGLREMNSLTYVG